MERGPIFLGGLAYSGKTQLRVLLDALPDVALTRRTYMWPRYYNRFGDLGRPLNFERCLAAMLDDKAIVALEPDPNRIRREFWAGPPTYARLFALVHAQHAARLGKRRWGDQLGFVERYAGPIFAAFPSARMIHLIRNPCVMYGESTSRTRNRPGKPGWFIARWLHSVRLMQRNQQRYPSQYKIVRYEMLCADPAAVLCDICGFLDEDVAPVLAALQDMRRAGQHPFDGDEMGAARRGDDRLSHAEKAFLCAQAGAEMAILDYAPELLEWSLQSRFSYLLMEWPLNRVGMAAWQVLKLSNE